MTVFRLAEVFYVTCRSWHNPCIHLNFGESMRRTPNEAPPWGCTFIPLAGDWPPGSSASRQSWLRRQNLCITPAPSWRITRGQRIAHSAPRLDQKVCAACSPRVGVLFSSITTANVLRIIEPKHLGLQTYPASRMRTYRVQRFWVSCVSQSHGFSSAYSASSVSPTVPEAQQPREAFSSAGVQLALQQGIPARPWARVLLFLLFSSSSSSFLLLKRKMMAWHVTAEKGVLK